MSLRVIFILIGLVYFFSPFDLVPDRLGWISRIDDLLVIGYLWWKYKKIIGQRGSGDSSGRCASAEAQGKSTAHEKSRSFDPYEVLELAPPVSRDQINSAYRRLMAQYHPDKVSHLGPELREVAHEKTIEIKRAYDMLCEIVAE